MSGIQALAAAAAQTQRLPTPTSSATGVRMVQPTLLTSQGVRVTPVPGSVSGAQTVRLSSGATILKAGTSLQGLQVNIEKENLLLKKSNKRLTNFLLSDDSDSGWQANYFTKIGHRWCRGSASNCYPSEN
jgi:hypothetical protein